MLVSSHGAHIRVYNTTAKVKVDRFKCDFDKLVQVPYVVPSPTSRLMHLIRVKVRVDAIFDVDEQKHKQKLIEYETLPHAPLSSRVFPELELDDTPAMEALMSSFIDVASVQDHEVILVEHCYWKMHLHPCIPSQGTVKSYSLCSFAHNHGSEIMGHDRCHQGILAYTRSQQKWNIIGSQLFVPAPDRIIV